MSLLLEARNIGKVFRGGNRLFGESTETIAVDNFSLAIDADNPSFTTIAGESGSGKTTIARMLLGVLDPSAGQVLYQGVPLLPTFGQRSKTQLRRIQMIYQTPDTSLNPKQRIRKTIGRPLAFYLGMNSAKRDARVRELLSLVELEPNQYIDRLPGELSGGEKQRVCIARALAAEPELLICVM